ncbi:LOW QUALITY PROTEIN: cyclin-A3-3-like [Capsella rubella]|uniref:LOW QUALITY PROTEIN: cyclin-A3-3-like n=1 Tax=Capsella rubella TaxID=81985 RepID=UPI000CD59F28|nr:LOW QUALITY PROTEIN: cyclin-A3-3-like [Capsella rubella]
MLAKKVKQIHAYDNAQGHRRDASTAECDKLRHRLLAPQDNIQLGSDIDARSDDPQMCGDYVSDIYAYLRELEVKPKLRPLHDYMEKVQEDVTPSTRGVLIDWLVEVAAKYKLESETLYLTVSNIDRFLSRKTVNTQRLLLVAVSAMLLATKYEEKRRPKVVDFCYIMANAYTKQDVLKMEEDILLTLQFELGRPTINTFLRRFIRVAQEDFKVPHFQLEPLCCYLSELSMLDYSCVKFVPSLLAASAVFLARYIIRPEQHPWNQMLKEYTKYRGADLQECVGILHELYLSRRGGTLQTIRKKYKQPEFYCVATMLVSPLLPKNFWEDVLITINLI